jgi:hypothetical protein
LSSDSLALGYLNQSELTADRFIFNRREFVAYVDVVHFAVAFTESEAKRFGRELPITLEEVVKLPVETALLTFLELGKQQQLFPSELTLAGLRRLLQVNNVFVKEWNPLTDKVTESLNTMLENWRLMQSSDMDSAGDDADRFERSFYEFIDEFREWFTTLENKPTVLDDALAMPEVEAITDQLPAPLLLNFETELELILEGITRDEDEKYD